MGSRRRFTAEIKRAAVKLAVQLGAVTVRIVDNLRLRVNVRRKWVMQFAEARWEARAGAQLKSDSQDELERLRRDLKCVTLERDILRKKGSGLLREGTAAGYRFIERQHDPSVRCAPYAGSSRCRTVASMPGSDERPVTGRSPTSGSLA